MDWLAVLPRGVAISQIAWERRAAIRRMKECGLSAAQIAERLHVNLTTARSLIDRAMFLSGQEAPFDKWVRLPRGDLYALASMKERQTPVPYFVDDPR